MYGMECVSMLLSQFIPPSLSQTYSQMGSLSLGLHWESCSVISDSLLPHGIYSSWNSPGQNTGVGSHSLLQGIFPTQGSNPSLPHCRQVLYQLSYQESPRKLEWVAYPFSSGSSWPKNRNQGLLHCRQILYQLSYQGSLVALQIASSISSFYISYIYIYALIYSICSSLSDLLHSIQ